MPIHESILDAIGNTPLVRLRKLFRGESFEVFAKCEALNPGGSAKDRPALAMLSTLLAYGTITRDSVIDSALGIPAVRRQTRHRIIALPAYIGNGMQVAGITWVASVPANVRRGLERASAVPIMNDAPTGRVDAILEASAISGGAAHWLAVLRAVVVKELTILGRYPLEFVGAFLQIFLMVAVFTLAALMFVPADRTRGPEAASLGGTMVYGFVVFLFFIQTMWISGASLRREQKQGTLEQLYLSPAATSASLIARALVTTAFTGALALISLALMVALIGSLPAHNRALAGALLLLTLSGIFGAGFVFAALSLRLGETARVIATMAQFGFMIFCAPFFPFSVLPDWLRAVARLMPLAHSVDAFRSALMGFPPGHPELGPAPVGIAVVAAFGLLMPWLGLRFYRHCEEWARRNSYLTEH